jgi:zinc protease
VSIPRLDTYFAPWNPAYFPSVRISKPAHLGAVALLAAVALATQIGCSTMKSAAKSAVGMFKSSDPATTVYELPNGMRVLIREDHFAPVAALQVWVGAGAADEDDIEAGVAHVHEHMLFKGTSNRGVGEIAAEIESSGGRINAWTSWNETVYHIVVASRYADTGIEVLADAVRNSSFDPTELDKELGVVLEEWKRGEDSPSRRVFDALFQTAFTTHPYRRPVIGTKESIEGLTRERILSFFGRYYAPNNMTLVVVGNVDTAHMKAVIARAFGDFEKREIPRPVRPAEPPQTALRFRSERMDVRESQLAFGFHVPGATHRDAPLLDMLAFVLGGGESSRLYRRLVATSELATSVGAFAYTPPDPGLFVVTASLEAEDMDAAYEAAVSELSRIIAEGPTEEELARARLNLESDFVFRYETMQGQARELGYFLTVYGDPAYDRVYLAALNRATAADLQEVARRYLRPENLTVVTLLPKTAHETLTEAKTRVYAGVLSVEPTPAAASKRAAGKGLEITPPSAATPNPLDPQLVALSNGVRLIVAEHKGVPVFSIRAAMLGGVIAETADDNGISNFVAEMLTRGTRTRSREQLAAETESMAASLSGFSGHNSLGVSGTFLSATFDRAIPMFLEVLREPAFDASETEKTRRELLLSIKNRDDDTSRVAFDLAFRTVYPDHPYGMTPLGEHESVAQLGVNELSAFHTRALDPRNLVVTVVGDVDAARVRQVLGRELEKLTRGADPIRVPDPAPLPTDVRRGFKKTERRQAHVVLAYPSVDYDDPDRFPLSVLDNILSGQGGRLFYELRDRQSLAYSVTAFFTKGLARGLFGGYIATDPGNAGVAISGLLAEFAKLRDRPAEPAELARAQRYLIGAREIGLQTNGAMAEDMTFNELYGLGYKAGWEYADEISAVTLEDVQRVARQYLDPKLRTEIVVGPPDTAGIQNR